MRGYELAGEGRTDRRTREGKKAVWSGVRSALAQKHLRAVKTLAEIKADSAFKEFPCVRVARLSVMPVTDAPWARIGRMAGKAPSGEP